jgi:hypothetical protein
MSEDRPGRDRTDRSGRRWWGEFSGACGDLGTFLPYVLGALTVTGLAPQGILLGFGVFLLGSGLFYAIPIAVQPMKAVAALLLTQGLSAGETAASGILLGTVLLLNRRNVHQRCNLGARQRWGIETSFLIEKHQGYFYEHAFSHDWNVMRGYHYLMRLAHLSNAPGLATKRVKTHCREMGVQAFLRWVRESCANRWLSAEWLEQLRLQPPQLRLE